MRYLDMSVSDEVISKIVELTSFKNMKENPMANYSCVPAPVFDHSVSPFMRKGASLCSWSCKGEMILIQTIQKGKKNLPHVEFKLKTVNGQHITRVTNCC